MTPGRRQLPGAGEVFLDHVAWMVPDLGVAGDAFRRLGFRLTPPSPHGNADAAGGGWIPQGTANRLAMLESGYLELLTATGEAATPVAGNLTDSLARYTGVHLIAFSVADAAAEHARLAADGFRPQPLVPLRRAVEAADGSAAEVAFSVVRIPFGAMPEGRIQLLTHLTPEQMWQERHIARDNAVRALAEVVLCVADADEAAARVGRLIGRRPAGAGAGAVIELERGRVVFVTPERLLAMIPGAVVPALPYVALVTLESTDVAAARAFLGGRGVGLIHDGADAFCIDQRDSMGTYIGIRRPGSRWPLNR